MIDKQASFIARYKALLFWLLPIFFLIIAVFAIQDKQPMPIYVERSSLTDDEFSEIYKVTQSLGAKQFYSADLDEIANAVNKISWVGAINIHRDWHKGVVVSVMPRVAIANFGSEYLLDVSGSPFVPANKNELNNPNLVKLYSEPGDTKEVMHKTKLLNSWFAPLQIFVTDIVLTSRQTWLIKFNSGLRVVVDYERVDEKLLRLSDILKQRELNIDLKNISAVDLRYKNGFVITQKMPQ